MISSFTDKYRFLSNFWPCNVLFDGVVYGSVEHAYQAARTTDVSKRLEIERAPTPGDARRLGKRLSLRYGWDDKKYFIMLDLISQKFSRGSDLAEALLDTGNDELVEGNHRGDTFWGVCNGVVDNHLGKLIMAQRAFLRSNQ